MSSRADARLERRTVHPCLRIPEIQQLVFSSLRKRDCSRVALACKTFYEEAMDVIWADVESLVPFVRCMPPEILTETTRNGSHGRDVTIDFSRSPCSLDWSMFCKHARRVKSFFCSCYLRLPRKGPNDTVYYLSLDTMKAVTKFICHLGANGTSAALFPRLNTLGDKVISEQSTHWHKVLTASLCSSTLRSLSFVFCHPPHDESWAAEVYTPLKESLLRLDVIWPRLRCLHLTNNGPVPDSEQVDEHSEIINRTLKNLPQLQYFRADLSFHLPLIETLAELPLLQTLELRGDQEVAQYLDGRSHQISPHGFPSLRHLVLAVYTPASPMHLLHALRGSETLMDIDLNLVYTSSTADTDPTMVFEAIAQIPHLESLDIGLESWDDDDRPVLPTLSGKLLATFFKLRRLKKLLIEGFSDITLTDTDLANAASAWPLLEDIYFDPDDGRSLLDDDDPIINFIVPTISLCGVQALYNHCPNLRRIFLDVNDSLPLVNGSLRLPIAQTRNRAVERLTVRLYTRLDSPKEHYAHLIPTVIRLLFPQLIKLYLDSVTVEHEPVTRPEMGWLWSATYNWEHKYQHMEPIQAQQSLHRILAEMASEDVPLGTDDGHF